jgi:hypothetical protein
MKPVPDRDIHLLALSERQHSARNVWGRTNVDGIAAFAELRPGKVWLTSPLGGMASTQVVAGEVAEVDIDLAPGFTVAGRVVDDQGIGVAGARILVHGVGFSEEARVVARSGSDGRFEFGEMVTKSFGRIGARADGHAPSTMVFTSGAPGSVQELTLVLPGPGGRVRGTVRTPKGDPVAEARVRIGSDDHGQTTAPDGRQQDTAEPVLAMTDADGRFSLDGLAPGRQTMKVTARGWAPVQQVVDVRAGATVDIALALDAGVTLEGEVVDASGDPVGDARIQAFLGNDRVAVGARSAPDGRFTLEALPPGSLRLEVWSKEKGRAERTIDGVSGEVLRWTARLAEQPTIEGVVVDSLDDALEGWRVEARTVRKGLVFILTGVTDAEGRFVIEDCSENSYHVTAQAPALGALVAMEEHTVGQVKPGGPPIRIVVPRTAPPTATITGRVVLPDGSSAGNAQLDLARAEHTNSQTFHVDAETGAFTLGPLRSGRYRLSFEAPGYAASSLTIDDLKHDEVRDLGPLTLRQGGQVRARLHGVPLDATPSEFWLVTTPLASGPRRGLSALGGTALSASLPAGRYTLDVGGSVVASARHPFTIQEGVVTELDVDILRGVLQILRPVNLPPGVEATNLRMRMTDARGGLVADGGFWNEGPQGDRVRRLALVPGATYRIEVSVPGVDEPRVFDIHTTEVVDHVHTLSL